MSSSAGEAAKTAVDEEIEEIVIRVTDDLAVVFTLPTGESRWRWGRWLPDLTGVEVRTVLQALDPAVRAFIEGRRLTGRLVEVDPLSRALLQSGYSGVAEAGGWMQSTLRDRGQFLRVIRIRPATALTTLAGGVSALAAVAAQVQAAEMARDLRAIRQEVEGVSRHLQDQQIGAGKAAVEQACELVDVIRRHGRDGVESGALTTLSNELRKSAEQCKAHLQTALEELEAAGRERSPFRAERRWSGAAVKRVELNLHLLTQLHATMIQLGLAQAALYLSEGNIPLAQTHAATVTGAAGKVRERIEDGFSRIERLDGQLRALFDPQRGSRILPVATSGVISGKSSTMQTSIPVPRTSFRIPSSALSTALTLLPPAYMGVNAIVQSNAEKKLDAQMRRLARTSDCIRGPVEAATRNIGVLQSLFAELGEPSSQ